MQHTAIQGNLYKQLIWAIFEWTKHPSFVLQKLPGYLFTVIYVYNLRPRRLVIREYIFINNRQGTLPKPWVLTTQMTTVTATTGGTWNVCPWPLSSTHSSSAYGWLPLTTRLGLKRPRRSSSESWSNRENSSHLMTRGSLSPCLPSLHVCMIGSNFNEQKLPIDQWIWQ